jgi:hypothetical protein
MDKLAQLIEVPWTCSNDPIWFKKENECIQACIRALTVCPMKPAT